VYQSHQPRGTAIGSMGCIPVDSVVPPTPSTRKCSDGHELYVCHAQVDQVIEVLQDAVESALFAEGAHVQLVDDCRGQRFRPKAVIGPLKCAEVEPLGRTVNPFGLKARTRIRQDWAAVEREAVANPVLQARSLTGEVPALPGSERHALAAVCVHQLDPGGFRGPDRTAHQGSPPPRRSRAAAGKGASSVSTRTLPVKVSLPVSTLRQVPGGSVSSVSPKSRRCFSYQRDTTATTASPRPNAMTRSWWEPRGSRDRYSESAAKQRACRALSAKVCFKK